MKSSWKLTSLGMVLLILSSCTNLAVPTSDQKTAAGLQSETESPIGGGTAGDVLPLSSDNLATEPVSVPHPSDPFVSDLVLFYIPVSSDLASVPADVGQGDAAIPEPVVRQFKAEYERALVSFVPLAGVLGADRLHRWTNKKGDGSTVTALVQNWKSTIPLPNGYGLPQLILAMDGSDGGPVYCIIPPILDLYSQNRGIGRAAGLAGYGKPMTGSFLMRDGESYVYAQRFSEALLYGSLDAQGKSLGKSFLEPAPSLSAIPPSAVGLLPDGTKSEAFVRTWSQALDRGLPSGSTGNPDGSVATLLLTELDNQTILFQSFDQGRWAIIQTSKVNGEPILITSPFIELFVTGQKDIASALAKAFSLYGMPVSDSYALPLAYVLQNPEIKTAIAGRITNEHPYIPLLVQRFQRGLWVAVAKGAVPKAD